MVPLISSHRHTHTHSLITICSRAKMINISSQECEISIPIVFLRSVFLCSCIKFALPRALNARNAGTREHGSMGTWNQEHAPISDNSILWGHSLTEPKMKNCKLPPQCSGVVKSFAWGSEGQEFKSSHWQLPFWWPPNLQHTTAINPNSAENLGLPLSISLTSNMLNCSATTMLGVAKWRLSQAATTV